MDRIRRGNVYLVRLYPGEELGASLLAIAREDEIRSASVQGIGALENCEFGFYLLGERRYDRRIVPEVVELVGLSGNLTRVDGEPFLHAHAVCMKDDFTMVGGHFFRGTVAVNAEIWIHDFGEDVTREMDETVGLKLLRLTPDPGPSA